MLFHQLNISLKLVRYWCIYINLMTFIWLTNANRFGLRVPYVHSSSSNTVKSFGNSPQLLIQCTVSINTIVGTFWMLVNSLEMSFSAPIFIGALSLSLYSSLRRSKSLRFHKSAFVLEYSYHILVLLWDETQEDPLQFTVEPQKRYSTTLYLQNSIWVTWLDYEDLMVALV